jgi:hypothetical protein
VARRRPVHRDVPARGRIPHLHFVGLTWTLSGMLNEIARQARQAAAAIAGQPAPEPVPA